MNLSECSDLYYVSCDVGTRLTGIDEEIVDRMGAKEQ